MLHSWTGWGILGVDYSITSTFSCVFENSYNKFFFLFGVYESYTRIAEFEGQYFMMKHFIYLISITIVMNFFILAKYVFENFKLQLIFSIFSAFEKVFTKEKREKFVDRRLGLLTIHVTT